MKKIIAIIAYDYLCDKTKFLLYKNTQNDSKKTDHPIGNKMAKKALQDAALIKQTLESLKDPPLSDVSTTSTDDTVKNKKQLFIVMLQHF